MVQRTQLAEFTPRADAAGERAEPWSVPLVFFAKEAGQRYIITTKHHDGFALFRSQASPFNLVDHTPFQARRAEGTCRLRSPAADGTIRLPLWMADIHNTG